MIETKIASVEKCVELLQEVLTGILREFFQAYLLRLSQEFFLGCLPVFFFLIMRFFEGFFRNPLEVSSQSIRCFFGIPPGVLTGISPGSFPGTPTEITSMISPEMSFGIPPGGPGFS